MFVLLLDLSGRSESEAQDENCSELHVSSANTFLSTLVCTGNTAGTRGLPTAALHHVLSRFQ